MQLTIVSKSARAILLSSMLMLLQFAAQSQSDEFRAALNDILSVRLDSTSYVLLQNAIELEKAEKEYAHILEGVEAEVNSNSNEAREHWKRAYAQFPEQSLGKMWASYLLSTSYMTMRLIDEALPYSEESAAIAHKLDVPHVSGMHWIAQSVAQRIDNDYAGSFESAYKALEIFKAADLKNDIAKALVRIGTIHHYQDQFDTAVTFYFEGLRLYEELNNIHQVATVKNNLGVISLQMGEYGQALDYLRQSAAVKGQMGDRLGLSDNYQGMGNVFDAMGQMDSAGHYYEKSHDILVEENDSVGLILCLHNLGYIFSKQSLHEQALLVTQEAYRIAEGMNDTFEMSGLSTNIGYSLLDLGRTAESKVYFEKGLELALKGHSLEVQNRAYIGMADYCLDLDDYEHALDYYIESANIKEQLLTSTKTKQFAEMQTKYETEKKENEILQLNERQAKSDLAIEQQWRWIISLLAILLIGALGSFFLIYRRRQMAQIELANERARFQKKILDTTVLAQESERQRIAKDLHDGLVQSLVAVKMGLAKVIQAESVDGSIKSAIKVQSERIDEAAIEARNLSHQMMPRTLTESGLVSALDDMLHKTLGQTEITYRFEHFGIGDARFKPSIEVGLFRIAQELVNNIIKHSGAKSVELQLVKTKTHLVLHVEDDGKGFAVNDTSHKGGIGLSNIYSRASSVNGEVNYEEGNLKGTSANIRIPID